MKKKKRLESIVLSFFIGICISIGLAFLTFLAIVTFVNDCKNCGAGVMAISILGLLFLACATPNILATSIYIGYKQKNYLFPVLIRLFIGNSLIFLIWKASPPLLFEHVIGIPFFSIFLCMFLPEVFPKFLKKIHFATLFQSK
jgi:hypothetical protein